MPRRKKAEEPEKDNNERWLLTYSDMITLLLALFIMLYSISNVDAAKFKAFSAAFAKAFNNTNVTTTGSQAGLTSEQLAALMSGGGINAGSSSSGDDGTGSGSGSGDGNIQGNPLDEVYNTLKQYIDANHLETQITLVNTETYVTIRLKDSVMFYPDEYTMIPTSTPVLKNIAAAISKVYSRVDLIDISGHTAKVGSDDMKAWQLSQDRTLTVLKAFVSYGLPQDKFRTRGCSHFEPVATNDTEEGRAENRRVEIKITKAPVGSSKTNSTSSTSSTKVSSSQGTS